MPRRKGSYKHSQATRDKIVLLAKSEPPPEQRWSLTLLAEKAVELGYCKEISKQQIANILQEAGTSTTAKTRTIRLSDEQISALDALAKKLDISGQRGARFQPFIQWLADTSSNALAETAAALEIAAGCAAGEDWRDLIEAIEPDWPKE